MQNPGRTRDDSLMDHATLSNHDEQTQRAAESLKRQFGLFCSLLAEPNLIELMLNTDGAVWAERLRQRMHQVGTMPTASAESFIGTVASTLRRTVTRENLILQCELPGLVARVVGA